MQQNGEDAEAVYQRMRLHNPVLIPRNHVMESVIAAAMDGDDTPYLQWLDALRHPYAEELTSTDSPYQQPPSPAQRVYQTFCGT